VDLTRNAYVIFDRKYIKGVSKTIIYWFMDIKQSAAKFICDLMEHASRGLSALAKAELFVKYIITV